MKLPRWQPLALVLFACASLLLFLGTRGLNEPDEGRYAEIGREMVASGDWLVPHLNGIPHFQKPPLLYWATATSISVFGVNEWAARLPSALAALGVVALTYAIGRMLFDQKTGIAAALILLSSLEFFVAGRLLTPDMMMTFWITASIACLVRYGTGGGRVWAWLYFVAMGLGFMTKGPMGFVVPVAAGIAWQLSRRRSEQPLRLPWLLGVLLMLAIGLSWFIVLSIHDHQLFSYFAGYELVQRFASRTHGRSKPIWYFLAVLPAGLFPWTFFVFALIWRKATQWKKLGWRPSSTQWLLIGWVGIPLVILSLSGSKLPTYVLPLFPAFALAIGRWTRTPENAPAWNKAIFATLIGLAVVVIGVDVAEHLTKLELPDAYLILPGLIACLALLREHPVTTRLIVGLSTVCIWLACVENLDSLSSKLEQQASVKPLARRLLTAPDLDRATVFACEVRAHGWEFYLQRVSHTTIRESDVVLPLQPDQKARMIESPKDCEKSVLATGPAYGLVREEGFYQSKNFNPEKWTVLAQSGDFLLIASRDSALGAR
jgi:hypothetical protein